jgi:hypothetical protein
MPDSNRYIIFAMGEATAFDQVLEVIPSTGALSDIFYDLAEDNLGFQVDSSTKTDDTLQTDCYDMSTKRMYFQATQYTGDDDIGTTVIMFIDFSAKQHYIDTALSPWSFGYMGYYWVPVLN